MKLNDIWQQLVDFRQSKTILSISYLMSANLYNGLIGFLGSIIVLRHFSEDNIAILYSLISIMMIANQFGDLGITSTFIKLASGTYIQDPEKSKSYFKSTLMIKLALSGLIIIPGIIISGFISSWTFDTSDYRYYVMLMLLMSGIQVLSTYFLSALQVKGSFGLLSWAKVIPPSLKFIALLVLWYLGKGELNYLLAAFLLVPVITFLMVMPTLDFEILKSKSFFKSDSKEIFKYSKWICISVLTVSALGQTDILMVKAMAGNSELVRLLGGMKLASVLPIITTSVVTVLLPKVTSMNDLKELNYFFRKGMMIAPILCLFLAIGFPLSNYLIPLLIGEKYVASIGIFQVYLLGFNIGLFITPISIIGYKLNKEHLFALMNAVQLLVNILINYFFIPRYGAMAAAISTLSTTFIALFYIMFILYKEGVITYKDPVS